MKVEGAPKMGHPAFFPGTIYKVSQRNESLQFSRISCKNGLFPAMIGKMREFFHFNHEFATMQRRRDELCKEKMNKHKK